jgi:hypothetical protein
MTSTTDPVVVPRDRLFLGHEQQPRAPFLLRRDDLVTHGVILGRTGSGKTGLGVGLVEELALSGVPVLVVDPKGDMTNLALRFPGFTPAEFAPWVDATKSAAEEAARWRRGVEESGQPAGRVGAYRDAALVTVYAPGWVRGGDVPRVDVLPSLRPPRSGSAEMHAEQARGLVSAILGAAGVEADPTDPRHVFLVEVTLHRWSKGQDASIDGIVGAVQDPPFKSVGPMALDRFLPPAERDKLARALVAYARSAGRWHGGTPLDMDLLLAQPPGGNGPVRVSVFTIAHLEAEERMFFMTLLLEALLGWMAEQPGTSRLRAALLIEEARGLLPPHPANPPSKAPLARLLAQGRAFGVGVVLSTQHPVDLDYKALSNVGTWFLGGLRERDLQRDLATELRDRGVDEGLLAQLEKRTFLACTTEGKPRTFGARWALSYLRGPIAPTEIPLLAQLVAAPPTGSTKGTARYVAPTLVSATPAPAEAVAVAAPPPVEEEPPPSDKVVVNAKGALGDDPWRRVSLPVRATTPKAFQLASVPAAHGPGPEKNGTWRPSLFGQAHVAFSRPRVGAFEANVVLAVPLLDGVEAIDWSRAIRLDPARLQPGLPPGWQRFEDVPRSVVSAVFGLKAFQQARKDLESYARTRLAWDLGGTAVASPAAAAPAPAASVAIGREELRVRLGRALHDLGGGAIGGDLSAAAVEYLLGPDSPLAAAAGTTKVEAAERWRAPDDLHPRLERLVDALSAAMRRTQPAAASAGPAAAKGRPVADLIVDPDVRVEQVGLLWTSC